MYHQAHERESYYDMYMHVGVMDSMLFPVDYGSKKRGKIDVLEVLVHEMLHGFGFYSRLRNAAHTRNTVSYKVYDSFTLYDSYLYTNDAAITDKSRWANGQISVSAPVHFRTRSGSQLVVSNELEDSPGFGHVNMTYKGTEDSVMIPFILQHTDFDWNLKVPGWKTAPLGKLTIQVLETLGYTPNPQPSCARSILAVYERMVEA